MACTGPSHDHNHLEKNKILAKWSITQVIVQNVESISDALCTETIKGQFLVNLKLVITDCSPNLVYSRLKNPF